jgi:hypothetical protein
MMVFAAHAYGGLSGNLSPGFSGVAIHRRSAAYSLPIGSAWYVRCFTAWPDTGSTRTLGS